MKITELIDELLKIRVEHGDLDVYINTPKDGLRVRRFGKSHVSAGSACIFWDADELDDDSDIVCYLGE